MTEHPTAATDSSAYTSISDEKLTYPAAELRFEKVTNPSSFMVSTEQMSSPRAQMAISAPPDHSIARLMWSVVSRGLCFLMWRCCSCRSSCSD